MKFTKLDQTATKVAFRTFGVQAVYNFKSGDSKRVRVIIGHSVSGFPGDFDSHVMDARIEISLRVKDVAHPRSGETITVGSTVYTVAKVTANDGVVVTVAVR